MYYPFQNPDLTTEERVEDLVSRMTLEEKISQTVFTAPAIERLGIPAYNWWNECLHGVARAGIATVFPQSIGMAASWNTELIHRVAAAISDEARAKHHEAAKHGDRGIYKGLTFWSPNINIFRDPRWGRGQETYGEDPVLTSKLGVAFIRGLQGDDPTYLKLVATVKHYAAHSGPEKDRHNFDARVSDKDMRETYLPAFEACVKEGGVHSVMGAYNRTNGEPCCASGTLLQDILRDEWGFRGYVVSDCGAISDIYLHHKVTASPEESAALAMNNGCELNCGKVFNSLVKAVEIGLISEETIDGAVKKLFTARFLLGMFDPPERVAYAQIPYEVNDCRKHRDINVQMARESIVLLKNTGMLLPLDPDIESIAVIGPNAYSRKMLPGNYSGTPSRSVTVLDGIRERVGAETRVLYTPGCGIVEKPNDWSEETKMGFSEALAVAERADTVIMCMGLTADYEGEEGSALLSNVGGDRSELGLPAVQQELLEAVHATGKPVVLLLFNGSPITAGWAQENVPSIIEAWYPGGEGGRALADVLFGDYNPSGKLPITFVKDSGQLPDFKDYSMKGRTYRYMEGDPLYPFGFGLSYTSFTYGELKLSSNRIQAGVELEVEVSVKNSGSRSGEEVVQLYLSDLEACTAVPRWSLKDWKKISLFPGHSVKVAFKLGGKQMALVDERGKYVLEPGRFRVYAGGSQPDPVSRALGAPASVQGEFEVTR
jgi:beta-glucosidase